MRPKAIAVLLCLWPSAIYGTHSQAQTNAVVVSTIASPTRPQDSRGETVYEQQGSSQKNVPIVPGALSPPKPIKMAEPSYPTSLARTRRAADVTIEGVITPAGDLIDPKIIDYVDADSSKSVLDAVAKYRFKPATLDGKPVAVLTRIVVRFRIH